MKLPTYLNVGLMDTALNSNPIWGAAFAVSGEPDSAISMLPGWLDSYLNCYLLERKKKRKKQGTKVALPEAQFCPIWYPFRRNAKCMPRVSNAPKDQAVDNAEMYKNRMAREKGEGQKKPKPKSDTEKEGNTKMQRWPEADRIPNNKKTS